MIHFKMCIFIFIDKITSNASKDVLGFCSIITQIDVREKIHNDIDDKSLLITLRTHKEENKLHKALNSGLLQGDH